MALWKEIEQFKSNPGGRVSCPSPYWPTPGLTTWEEEERPAK